MEERQKLITKIVKEKMHDANYSQMKDLAQAMKIKSNTLSSNIRYMAKTELYNSDFANALFDKLKISLAEFEELMKEDPENVEEIVGRALKDKSTIFSTFSDKYNFDIQTMLEDLDEDNRYFLITTKPPWEFSNNSFKLVILKALAHGVRFEYVFPEQNNTAVKDQLSKYWYEGTKAWKYLSQDFEEYKNEMKELFNKKKDVIYGDLENRRSIKTMLGQMRMTVVEDPYLVNSLYNLIILEENENESEPEFFVFMECQTTTSLRKEQKKSKPFFFMLPYGQAEKIYENVTAITDN